MNLPQDWKLVSLDEVAVKEKGAIKRGPFGGSIKKEIFVDHGYLVYEQQHVIENDFTLGRYFIDEKKFDEMKDFSVKANDLLISCAGTIGKVALVPETARDGIINQALMRIRPDTSVILPIYLSRYLESPAAQQQIFSKSSGTALKNLAAISEIKKSLIPLPPITQQKRIAAILDKADAVRRKRREAIRLTEELLRSTFLEMFGDPITNPKCWELRKFSLLGSLERGKSKHRPRNEPSLLGGPYPLIQTGDISNSEQIIESYTQTYSEKGLAQSRMWKAGTLCITIAANIAQTAILGFDACFPDSVVGFRSNGSVKVEYIQAWLRFLQPILEKSAPQSAQKNINLETLRNLEIPVPPVSLQDRYSQIFYSLYSSKKRYLIHEKSSENLFDSLLQRAFTGNL